MITDVHTSYLAIMVRTSEAATNGWAELLGHATTSQHPETVLAGLGHQHDAAALVAEGWRDLLAYAEAHQSLPAQLSADISEYATGARLDAPPKPCACGDPVLPGIHHQDGRPCYLEPSPSDRPVGLVDDRLVPTCTCGDTTAPEMIHLRSRPCYAAPSGVPWTPGAVPTPASLFVAPTRAPESNPYPEPPDGGTRILPDPFGGPLPEGQEHAVNALVADHLEQDHAEALEEKAKREKGWRP